MAVFDPALGLWRCRQRVVDQAWCDANGHMNVAYYVMLVDQALDEVFEALGVGESYIRDRQMSLFTVEMNISYKREAVLGDSLNCDYHILEVGHKVVHLLAEVTHADGTLAATAEQLTLSVNMATRSSAVLPEDVRQTFSQATQSQWPDGAGKLAIRR